MKRQNITALCLALLLALLPLRGTALALEAASAKEKDFSVQQAKAERLSQLGLFLGEENGDFDLSRAPTRAEALVMLIRLLGCEKQALEAAYPCPFADVPVWAAPYVGFGLERGLARGVSETRFGMGEADCAMYLTFVLRALGYSDAEGDFVWKDPFALARQSGILPQGTDTARFLRADVVSVSYAALSARLKGEDRTLAQRLVGQGVLKELELTGLLWEPDPNGTRLEILFFDVGQADAALLRCDGQAMLIDGGNAADSSLLYTQLKEEGIGRLDCVVCTHPHEDHAGGLAGALNAAQAGLALAPVEYAEERTFLNFLKYLGQQGVSVTVPAPGDRFFLGGAQVQVVGPLRERSEINNNSLVLRVSLGETSFLFTGDAEREEEQDLLDSGFELESTLLKVGHHGSDSSTSYAFLRAVAPQAAVISAGAGNPYGHPSQAVLSRLRDAGTSLYRTDLQGWIRCVSDGKSLVFETEREAKELFSGIGQNSAGAGEAINPSNGQKEADYVVNLNTGKFHLPSCPSARSIRQENRLEFFGTREELLALRFVPCGTCKP